MVKHKRSKEAKIIIALNITHTMLLRTCLYEHREALSQLSGDVFHPTKNLPELASLSLASASNCFKARMRRSLYSDSQLGLDRLHEKCEYRKFSIKPPSKHSIVPKLSKLGESRYSKLDHAQ